MAKITIKDHSMELSLSFSPEDQFCIFQREEKLNKNATGTQAQSHQATFNGVDPYLLELALLELGYQKIHKV
jgi:hypothetical protein